jgi:YspA, cpYpsA-related SLOG family/MalK OB fold domain
MARPVAGSEASDAMRFDRPTELREYCAASRAARLRKRRASSARMRPGNGIHAGNRTIATTVMRVLVCGGRSFEDREALDASLDELHRQRNFDLLIAGGARGADRSHDDGRPHRHHAERNGAAGGPPRSRSTKPANRFVAAFIGSPSMNFLPIRLESEGGKLYVKGHGFQITLARQGRCPAGRGGPGCSPRHPPGEPAAGAPERGRQPAARDGRDRRGRGLGHLPGSEHGGCVHNGARRADGTRRSGAAGQSLSRPGANPPLRPGNRDQPSLS